MMTRNTCRTGLMAVMAASIALAYCVPVWAAENIQGMDFITTPSETNIILHSGHNVPYQTVQATSEKLIIDLDNVNAQDSIETFFKGSANINHVILQPLSQTKLRVIVKGEDLGAPTIGFDHGGGVTASAAPASDTLDHQTQQALHDMENDGTSAATYNPQALGNADNGMNDATNTGTVAATGTSNINTPTATQTAATAPANAPEPQGTGAIAAPVIQHADSPATQTTLKQAQANNTSLPIPLADIAKYGILAALLLGLGIFIKRKIDSLRTANASFDSLMLEQQQGKAVSFQELANAYRNDNNNNGGKRTLKPYGSRSAAPIGLSHLNARLSANDAVENQRRAPQPAQTAAQPMTPQSLQQMQQRLAAASRNNIIPDKIQTAPPAKQAINQYAKAKQQAIPAKKAPAAPREFKSANNNNNNNALPNARSLASAMPKRAPQNLDDLLKSEQARVQDVKQQLGVKPSTAAKPASINPAAKPTAQQRRAAGMAPSMHSGNPKNGPLPDNPAVLNFLKDVADRIDKEGKPGLAKAFQKGLES